MKLISYFFLPSLLLLFFAGCSENEISDDSLKNSISLKNTEQFVYDFLISGDEEGATITEQALHYEISEIMRNAETGWSVVYCYKPESGFTGIDSVEIQTCTGSTGADNPCPESETRKFVFRVTD